MREDDESRTVLIRRAGADAPPVPLAEGSALEAGAEVGGRYRIQRLLGAGGMGRVWLAEDMEQQREIAFKEMQIDPGRAREKIEESALLFRREYFAMKKLQHPGTVKVYDCGVMDTGNRYITMEVVRGEDLSDVVRRAPLSSRDASRILIQMAQILAFVHSRLFVHCDIKPSNVRLTAAGRVKLMDFGVMHPIGTLLFGKVRGTLAYMAPEWQRGGAIDGRADLYSLGVLAFFMLTGRTPFTSRNMVKMLDAHLRTTAPRVSVLVVDVEPALDAIVARLLEKDPNDRYTNAAELVAALCAASGEPRGEEPVAARASYLQTPVVVGRGTEMADLSARLAAARQHRARALLLGALAGVGKSRLLQEFELDARVTDVPFAIGQCRAEGLSPRAPLEQALRALVPVTPPAILDPVRPVLSTILPGLAMDAPPSFRDPSAEKIAVFDALSRWLRGLAEVRPFVLCFEDLHWADSATLEHMNVIIRALDGTGGLVLGAFRSDEIDRLGLAFQTVDEGVADHTELAPLSEADLLSLVTLALQGSRLGEAFVARLHAITRGNVFFAMECLRALIEGGALTRILGEWSAAPDLADRPLPRSIEEAVLARVATLTPEDAAFFQKLAPVGRVLDMPLIEAITDVDAQALFESLDEGIERQFLQYAAGRYFFTHDTVREAIYASTPDAMRKAYHGRIATYLTRSSGGDAAAARAIGYHFAHSLEPTRAIPHLLRAGDRALANKALLEAFRLLEEAAGLLEAHPDVPGRDEALVTTWGTLIEVAYHSSTPACIRYAEKLFQRWDAAVNLRAGGEEVRAQLAEAHAAPVPERAQRLQELFREIPERDVRTPAEVFRKRAEHRVIESIALAIMGRTAEFHAGLERTALDHPPESPYRAAAMIAKGGLTAHTGRFRGVVDEQREHLGVLRAFRAEVAPCPRRLGWALGMGAYFLNMNLALMGMPLDERATRDGFEVAEEFGFTDLRLYHLFSQVVRASFTGDGPAFMPPFTEMNDLIRKLGNPRLPERNLSIYTPPFYLERREFELAAAIVQRGARLSKLLPGDRWLKMYVEVYDACLRVATGECGEGGETDQALDRALATARAGDFRMETLVLVYRSRFERARGDRLAALRAADAALARATDPALANPFDEIMARRARGEALDGPAAAAELLMAHRIAERTGNVLQSGTALYALARALRDEDEDRAHAAAHLAAAAARFAAARADAWLRGCKRGSGDP